jgi:hypothetical protein
LQTKSSSILFAAMLILVSGCHKQSNEPSHEQLQANVAFDTAQAMKMFYGNYDAEKRTSVVSLPMDKSSLPGPGEEEMTVKPLFHAYTSDGGAQNFMLVTYAVPPEYGCHACAPIIGMAAYSQKGSMWTMDASNRAITIAGGWGEPPKDIQLVQVGPNHHAVQIIDVDGGQGETATVMKLLVQWNDTVSLGLERIIADDDKGMCNPNGGLPCCANHRTVTFITDDKVEYYGLTLELVGTDLPTSDAATSEPARKVSGLETLKFENGKYIQVSRQGDLTTADLAVAKREGLR